MNEPTEATQEGGEERSVPSFSYSVDSKGNIKPSAKAYHPDIVKAEALAAAVMKTALARIASGEFQVTA
jgi:hypothetical protein